MTANPPQTPLGIFDFTPTGGLIALAGIAFLALFGKRLLPNRAPTEEQLMVRHTSSDLEDMYQLGERLWEVRVLPNTPLAGARLGDTGIGDRLGLTVAAIWRGHQALFAPPDSQIINTGDLLLIVGREERVSQLVALGAVIGREPPVGHISDRGVSLIEVILAPHSRVEGRTLRELDFRRNFGFTAVALLRGSRSYRTDVGSFKLTPGDSLLMVGSPDQLRRLRNNADFIVLEPDASDQPIQKRRAILTGLILVAAIGLSVAGFPVFLAMLIGAILLIVTGLLSMEDAYRAMEWRAIFLIAGMYSVSVAMVQTGLATLIGNGVLTIVSPLGPLGLAAGSYLLTAVLTQFMGGQVTALVTGPIAISAAISMNTSPQAMAVAAAIGCSAAFLTPIAHPVNILVMGPGNYRFSDFLRAGLWLTVLSFIFLMLGMILFWGL